MAVEMAAAVAVAVALAVEGAVEEAVVEAPTLSWTLPPFHQSPRSALGFGTSTRVAMVPIGRAQAGVALQ